MPCVVGPTQGAIATGFRGGSVRATQSVYKTGRYLTMAQLQNPIRAAVLLLGLCAAACGSDAPTVMSGEATGAAVSTTTTTVVDAVADDSVAIPDAAKEPTLTHCMSNNTAEEVTSSNVDGVNLDFERQTYLAGENASYAWTTGSIDFVAGFYFTVECWDGDRWLPAWRAFVFDEPSYQALSVDLGEVPAIGYGPQPGTVVIPPGAPDGTYRLMVIAVGNDEATGERIERLQVTGGFGVGDGRNLDTPN